MAAENLARRVVGVDLDQDQANKAGMAFHYLAGWSWTPVYLLLRRRLRWGPVASGLGTGASMSLLLDETITPAIGASAPNDRYPVSTHVRAFAAHLLFGLAVAGVMEAGTRLLPADADPPPAIPCLEFSMSDRYDLIVIGAGMAGVNAANKSGAAGWRVAIVDELAYGGTCALRGCDPKKILRRGAEIIDAARLLQGRGIDTGGLAINWSDLMGHKRGFTDPVPDNMERGLEKNGVETLHGTATFTGPSELEIKGRPVTSNRFLIATGARPRPLDFPGAEHLTDSTDFLHLDALPGRVLFVGGGFVSMEFAHISARAGAAVTVIDRGERPLKGFDPDLVDLLVARSTEVGIDSRARTSVRSVEPASDCYRVTLERDGTESTVEVDLVVHGAGRVPELSRLGLDDAGVDTGPKGIAVAPHLQSTTNPAVWAAGDSADTPGMPLTPVAVFEGKVAASNMLKDQTTAPDYDGVATVVYTIPELARVGMLEADARQTSIDLDVRYRDTSSWFSNYRVGERTAATKILVDRDTDTIVGAHMLGPEYGELINFCALAIELGLTTRQLKSMTASYPSVTSDLGSML